MFFKKTKNLIIFLKNDCFQLPFEVYYVFVAQKLKILENAKHFFLSWTLATPATSRGPNFDLSNLNRVSNFSWRCQLSYEILFVDKNENLEALDCVLQNGLPQPPPHVFNRPKSPCSLGLTCILKLVLLKKVLPIIMPIARYLQYLQYIVFNIFKMCFMCWF